MCEFGVLPIENNSYGSVRGVYEALRTAGVHIVHGDRILIRHQLLVKPGTKFEELPEDFVCPLCFVGKEMFSEVSA